MVVRENKIKSLREVETEHILHVLRLLDGNRTRTAKALQISVRKLRYRLDEAAYSGYEVEPPRTGL